VSMRSRASVALLFLWSLTVLSSGGVFCLLQQRFVRAEHVFVAPGSIFSVLDDLCLPERSGAHRFGQVFFSYYMPKSGVYKAERLGVMLLNCVRGKQKLFPVVIVPGDSEFETQARLEGLPYLDHAKGWVGPYNGFFPDTYYVAWGTPVRTVLKRAEGRLLRYVQNLWESRGGALRHFSSAQMVVLASIVEKETSLPCEYKRIISAYVRRLKPDFSGRLWCCATVQYCLKKLGKNRKNGRLFYKDLNVKDQYNTYRKSGLPPSPIANPSVAVLNVLANMQSLDAESDYFFWCAKCQQHIFSASLRLHVQKRQWHRSKCIPISS